MATLQKIRGKAGLLVGVIGVALLAFIVGDLLNSGHTFFNMNRNKIAVVNGKNYSGRISGTSSDSYRRDAEYV